MLLIEVSSHPCGLYTSNATIATSLVTSTLYNSISLPLASRSSNALYSSLAIFIFLLILHIKIAILNDVCVFLITIALYLFCKTLFLYYLKPY